MKSFDNIIKNGSLLRIHDIEDIVNANRNKKKIVEAINICVEYHKGQLRRGTILAYHNHPISVFLLLESLAINDENTLIASLLHDILEDTNISPEKLIFEFGNKAFDIIKILSKKGIKRVLYFEKINESDRDVKLIKGLDRLHNLLSLEDDRLKEYIEETDKYIYPFLKDDHLLIIVRQKINEIISKRLYSINR